MTDAEQTQIEAAVYRRLRDHLQKRTDVQNIDLMILADFCRNCLGKWTHAEAQNLGVEMTAEDAKSSVYGMPYSQWKADHQAPASAEQMAAFEERRRR
ncbi:MAG: DUF1244 domain-containing protein [Myxococcota bacterium]|jgi:hypothetical protein|nr:DUF1244 domain-containing protein [Myxococcota bacterium]